MSRLPTLTATKILKILFRLGFVEVQGKGSHKFLKHPDGRTTTIPCHRGEDIGRGLLRKILRDIQIEPEEFIRLL